MDNNKPNNFDTNNFDTKDNILFAQLDDNPYDEMPFEVARDEILGDPYTTPSQNNGNSKEELEKPSWLTAYEVRGDESIGAGKIVTFSKGQLDETVQVSTEKKQQLDSKIKKIAAIAGVAGIISLGIIGLDVAKNGELYSPTSGQAEGSLTFSQILERTPDNFKSMVDTVSKRGK